MGPRLLLITNRKSHKRYRLVPKSTTLDNLTQSVSKHVRLSEPITKIWMKIDPNYQRRGCSPEILDSGNRGLCRYSQGFPGEEASKDSGVIENVDFQCFQTLRLWHLRKWGQRYYIVLFSPLSPFHWPQNRWPWMAILRSIFNFHY